MVLAAGADLHLELEALRVAGLGQQLLRLLRVVGEQLLDRFRHRAQRLEIAGVVRVLRIGEQFGIAAVVLLDDFLLVHRHVQRAAHADIVERLGVDAQRQVLPGVGQPAGPLELRRALLQFIDGGPAHHLQHVELAGAQHGVAGGLVLDGAQHDLVGKGQLVVLAADLLGVPVLRVLRIRAGIALHELAQRERAGAGDVLPVRGARGGDLLGHDAGVVAPAEAVVPFRIEFLEAEHDRMLVHGLDLAQVIEVGGDLLGAGALPAVAEHHVLRGQLTLFHHARLGREAHVLAQLDFERERIGPFPAFGEFAADGILGQPGVGLEGVLAAVAAGLGQVGGEELLIDLAGVVVLLPVPVAQVPRQGGDGGVDRTDFDGAAILRRFRLRGRRAAGEGGGHCRRRHRQGSPPRHPAVRLHAAHHRLLLWGS
ncbi:hypothetical protein D9M68_587300 [compost metagenome]